MEKRFGTFNGVFLPTFLTIIGVIYFLRLSWVVGSAGLLGAITIIVVAHIITIATAFSMASITTNMQVKGGGAYYLISRSLGLEVGGSIGITLYLSQAISVALYVIGFIESVKRIFPKHFQVTELNPVLWGNIDKNTLVVSLIVAFSIGLISIIGADLAMKAQYVIFAVIIMALISIFLPWNFNIETKIVGDVKEAKSFWNTFSIFFPAVTGILAGVSMSGDLKNPQRSIVKGTFLAIAITFVIYMFQAVWFSVKFGKEELLADPIILITKTKFSVFIIGGIWAATLSSALGSIVAAPRTMQALAKDGVLPKIFAKGSGKADEPRIATIFTFGISLVFIVMGNLDLVAPIITMFFLNTYGAVNLVAGLEVLVGNPSYRPTFKTPWYVSLIGAFGSYWVMFLINKNATIVSLIVTVLIYLFLGEKRITRTWGDLRTGLWISIARFALLKTRFMVNKNDDKNWKPDIMVFSGSPKYRARLVYLADLLSKGRGIITLFTYVTGDIKSKSKTRESTIENMNKFLESKKIMAFPEVVISKSFREAATITVQANGFGNIKANTVLLGITEEPKNRETYTGFISDMVKMEKNILILKYDSEKSFGAKERIDVWWGGLQSNGRLMLLMAHIISLNDDWKNVDIRVKTISHNSEEGKITERKLKLMLENARIKGRVELIEAGRKTVSQIIGGSSKDADLVILGLAIPIEGMEEEYIERMNELTKELSTTIFVKGMNVSKLC